MSATAASTLRERLDRLTHPGLSGAPRRRPQPALYTPRGFEVVSTPYGDALMRQDVPRIIGALEELGLVTQQTMVHVDDGPAVFARPRQEQ